MKSGAVFSVKQYPDVSVMFNQQVYEQSSFEFEEMKHELDLIKR